MSLRIIEFTSFFYADYIYLLILNIIFFIIFITWGYGSELKN